jgi:hypothetical protein
MAKIIIAFVTTAFAASGTTYLMVRTETEVACRPSQLPMKSGAPVPMNGYGHF